MIPQFYSQLVKAGLAAMVSAHGKVLTVKKVGGTCRIALDGKQPQTVVGGAVLPGPFSCVNIFNDGTVDFTVTFFVGDDAVQFQPQDNSQTNAQSYLLGNLGIATSAAANSTGQGAPACDGNGFLQITAGMNLTVAGTNNGNRRQILTLSVDPNAAVALNVLDQNGFIAITLQKGAQIELLTDSTVALSGNGGTVGVSIGQIFLTNN